METSSPPMTPTRQYMSPLETSPTNSYREHLRRRSSSYSSNHNRSPVSQRKYRFSNASQYSNDFTPDGGGMGNLADELDQLDDEEDFEDELAGMTVDGEPEPSPTDGARDSGIDVSYSSKKSSPRVRNFSKPFSEKDKPPDEEDEDKLSQDLEVAMSGIARFAANTSVSEDPLIPRTIALLQDLGNQSTLEAHTQRLTTATNSMTAYVLTQTKAVQTLASAFYSPFSFTAPIDTESVEEIIPLVDTLVKDLPLPDPTPLHGLQKLDRETTNTAQTLSQLTDTLQMGKQTTNAASRHLRTTQTLVAEMRRERERGETAREELSRSGWSNKIKERWCSSQCKDIMAGFEEKCNALRAQLAGAGGSA